MCWNWTTGRFTDAFDPAEFDYLEAAENPETSVALEEDPASIGRKPLFVTVYVLRDEAGDIDKVILPVHGYGLWSTLYGFVALEEDGNDHLRPAILPAWRDAGPGRGGRQPALEIALAGQAARPTKTGRSASASPNPRRRRAPTSTSTRLRARR
jgi:hypothetical protein